MADARLPTNDSASSQDGIDLPRLAFIHVPRTAGASVTTALKKVYGTGTFPGRTTIDYKNHDDHRLSEYRFYKGHAYRRDYERLPPQTVRFTVLRDPFLRAVSYYNHCRGMEESDRRDRYSNEAIRLAKHLSVVNFIHSHCPAVVAYLRLGQLRQFLPGDTLAAVGFRTQLPAALGRRVLHEFKTELAGFDFAMTCESLSLSFHLMAALLDLPVACRSLVPENVSAPATEIEWAEIRQAVVQVNALEFECYEFVRKREQAWLAATLERFCDVSAALTRASSRSKSLLKLA